MADIHDAASIGFGRAADAYERGRPEYSQDAARFVFEKLREFHGARAPGKRDLEDVSRRGLTIADVGAGTGKFTRVLASFPSDLVARISAVEPVAEMRTKIMNSTPMERVTVFDGTAERLPFADASLDVVTVAQAFHWFDGSRAIPEIYRVLKHGGLLLLIWNVRDESYPWIREMTELMVPYEGTAPRYRSMKWREAFDREHESSAKTMAHFSPLEVTSVKHVTRGSIDVMLDRVASVSFVASLPQSDRAELLAKMRELYLRELRGVAEDAMAQDAELAMPYEAQIFTCFRS